MTEYSEGFYITMATLIIGFMGLSIRQCLQSKCDEVVCCCLKIHRDVNLEERIDEMKINNGLEKMEKSEK